MPRLAAGGAAEGGFAGGGRLEDAAFRTRVRVVGRGFARGRAVGAIGQGFRAVHFVEVGSVDAEGGTGTARGMPSPRPSPREGRGEGEGAPGAMRWGDAQPG
jgi:hypothetical protein